MKKPKYRPTTRHVTYIAAKPQKIWHALTRGELTKQYFFVRRIEVSLRHGGAFRLWQPDGTLDVEGRVNECDAPRRLSVTWRVMWIPEFRKLPDCLVTYQIDDLGKVSRLTLTEAHQIKLDDKLLEGGRRGWPMILCGLKTLVETGKPLPKLDFMGENRKTVARMKKSAKAMKK
jgi:uncharacterized protein YndB with AHSA1/START domain